jgi:hypothetical protein
MKNKGILHHKRKKNKSPVADPREMEIYELLEKDFKIIILMFSEKICNSMESGK